MKYALDFEPVAFSDSYEFEDYENEAESNNWELDEYSEHECESCAEYDQEIEDEYNDAVFANMEEEVRKNRFRPSRIRPHHKSKTRLRPRKRPASRFRPIPRPVLGSRVVYEPLPCVCPAHRIEFVRWVQSSLNQILGLNLPINGLMNRTTRDALRDFQKREGLQVDGIAGPETEKALIEAKTGRYNKTEEPPESSEFEMFDDETDEFDEMEIGTDTFQWPRQRTFNPPPAKTIPSGPYQTGSQTCSAIEQDLQDLIVSIGPFNRSVSLLYKLTKQKPRNQTQIDNTAKQAKRQMTNLKINLEKMRDRTQKGFYLRNGCTQKDIAKVTCKVRSLQGEWRRIASMEKLRDQLVYWLRNSRGAYAKVSCSRL